MHIFSRQKYLIKIAVTLLVLSFPVFLYAQQSIDDLELSLEEDKSLTDIQKQARLYRAQGLQMQQIGDLAGAMSLYQKATELDPGYAVAWNDLGVVYDANGVSDRAEECYLKATKIDPNYLSAYTNLAFLYENQRDFGRAAYYWKKRAELGAPDDTWTQKAKQRLEDIDISEAKRPMEKMREQEVLGMIKDIEAHKSLLKKDNKTLAKDYLLKAKLAYKSGNEVAALKQAIDASQLDPSNEEIQEFVDKIQKRLLSR